MTIVEEVQIDTIEGCYYEDTGKEIEQNTPVYRIREEGAQNKAYYFETRIGADIFNHERNKK